MFYRAGVKMREHGNILFEQMRKDYPELDTVPEEPSNSKARKRERNSRGRTEADVQANEKETSGGVNRRTAVLFTRKAKARANKSGPTSIVEDEVKKKDDSFKVYR